jgi:hypothetical protein
MPDANRGPLYAATGLDDAAFSILARRTLCTDRSHIYRASQTPVADNEVDGQWEAATNSSARRTGCSRKIPWSVSISTSSAPTDAAITC